MDREQYLLMKLAEEASEVIQISLKAQQFGFEEKHPELQDNNMYRCHCELNDLLAIVELLNEECNFGFVPNQVEISKKKAKVEKYYEYSKKRGKVDDSWDEIWLNGWEDNMEDAKRYMESGSCTEEE